MTVGLTSRGAATKHRMVEGTALLMREQGVAETNLEQVLHATATSKGQLFHYFPDGRAGLLRAVAAFEADQVMHAQRPFIDDLSTLESWRAWRDAVVRHYSDLGQRCPMGALISELGNSSPEARAIVSDLYDRWEHALTDGLRALVDAGLVPSSLRVGDTGRSILTAIQGGVVTLRATDRVSFLETALDMALVPVLGSDSTGH
jgi:AcrR family transcriptional regulator